MLKVKKTIEKLSNTESRVLISGPTGSGKELVARKIHKQSIRNKAPFVVINAASLKEKTYEKELFGQEFNDGTVSYGALDRANKGTLLIDEVTEIPIETQANILRVLISLTSNTGSDFKPSTKRKTNFSLILVTVPFIILPSSILTLDIWLLSKFSNSLTALVDKSL